MASNDKKNNRLITENDKRHANYIIQGLCVVGFVACVLASIFQEASISVFVYAILGGGILGTENVISLIKTVFRIGDDK